MELDLENPLSSAQDLSVDATTTSLFDIESDHMPPNAYPHIFKATDSDVSARREIISLILQFSQQYCDPFLSYLAINYLDRFLSTQSLLPWMLRLLAVSCVCLALKMRKTEYSVTDIQHDGGWGFIFDAETVGRMEFLILGALKWRMRSVTPFSFIEFFTSLFKSIDLPLKEALKARATEIIIKAQNELKLLEFKPSIVAASALLSASHELLPLQFPCFRKEISNCSYVDKDDNCKCYCVIEEIALDGYENRVLDTVSSSNTPVNVLDRQWSNSSSESERNNNPSETQATATTRAEERNRKRRKVSSSSFRSWDNTFRLSLNQPQLQKNRARKTE